MYFKEVIAYPGDYKKDQALANKFIERAKAFKKDVGKCEDKPTVYV
jgi:hypothetical protein